MNRQQKVSLCIIAKNEEHCITACINSVKHLVSEIIVVDSGSDDRTVELAAAAGAHIYNYEWQNDFAEARNYALEQATGDWILALDADEILEHVEFVDFDKLITAPGVEGYFINIHSLIGDGEDAIVDQVVRLFKNKPLYRFRGAIHEQVAGSIKLYNDGGGLACANLTITHSGYLAKRVEMKNKRVRNIGVIEKALAGNPSDPLLLYSLGMEYMQSGDISKGNAVLEKALMFLRGGEGYFQKVLTALMIGLYRTGETDKLKPLLDKALRILPDSADLHVMKGITLIDEHNYDLAIGELRLGLSGECEIVPKEQIYVFLGNAYIFLGCYDNAKEEYLQACRLAARQGKGCQTWIPRIRFTSRDIDKDYGDIMRRMGGGEAVLILLLFNILTCAADSSGNQLVEACSDFRNAVLAYESKQELDKMVIDYFKVCAEQMAACAQAVRTGLGCDLFAPLGDIRNVAASNLDLAVEVFYPSLLAEC